MILIDFPNIAYMSVAIDSKTNEPDWKKSRANILSQIKAAISRYPDQPVILCADRGSWRSSYFKFYKANRKKISADGVDWLAIASQMAKEFHTLGVHFPYITMEVEGCEADDIIAVLARRFTDRQVFIWSSDKDFRQLQSMPHVFQYSPRMRSTITELDSDKDLRMHIAKGDTVDGIPNILTRDDIHVLPGVRSTVLSKKFMEAWMKSDRDFINLAYEAKDISPSVSEARIERNTTLIDLSRTPDDLVRQVNENFDAGVMTQNTSEKIHLYMLINNITTTNPKWLRAPTFHY